MSAVNVSMSRLLREPIFIEDEPIFIEDEPIVISDDEIVISDDENDLVSIAIFNSLEPIIIDDDDDDPNLFTALSNSITTSPSPPIKTEDVKIRKKKAEKAECCICLSSLGKKKKVRVLDCGHVYHAKCIDPWLSNGKSCALCRN